MTEIKKRPETLNSYTTKIITGLGNLYLTVSELDGKPFEVFAIIGKSGTSITAKTEEGMQVRGEYTMYGHFFW